MTKIWAALVLGVGLVTWNAPAQADVNSVGRPLRRACLQLTAAPEAPLRPSGREVRIVTYTVVRTLNVGDVGHPAFFVYPNEREDAGHCEGTARRAFEPTISPPRGRGDARQR